MPTITEPTREQIEEIISTGESNRLLNLQETSWFEFREKHYATTAPEPGGFKAKYELAKDCSSISNSGGGFIFIGLKPALQENRMTEYVESIPGIPKADVNLASWRDSLMNMLTPRFTLEDIEHGFINIDDIKAVLWMRVPDARERGIYPLILHNDQSQQGEHRIKGKVIGLYERHGAENVLMSAEKIQSYISQGLSTEESGAPYTQDFSRIEAKLDKILSGRENPIPTIDTERRLEELNNNARSKIGDDNEPYFYIYASPKNNLKIPDFLTPYSESTSVPQLMKNPPTLRRMGWDLSVAAQEHPAAEPGAWEIMNGNRKLLTVTEKAEVFAAATISRFLDWGMDNPSQQQQNPGYAILINEYAFAEFIAMFFRFLEKIAERTDPSAYQISFGFVGTNGLSVGLHEPIMQGIPSNGTLGPMRSPSAWQIDDIDPTKPYLNAGFVMQNIIRMGFGGTEDSQYFVRNDGILSFDASSYARQ